jgi:hypothetical protein
MNQYPWLKFFSGTFIFWVIVSDEAVGRIGRISNVDFVVFGGVDHIGIMLFHDGGNKKNPAFAGFESSGE